MSSRAHSRVEQYLGSLADGVVPVDICAIAKDQGVTSIEPRLMQEDGYLGLDPDGKYTIRYKEGAIAVRRRFTIAHEIAHILIANYENRSIDTPVARGGVRDNHEERLANRIAAELLMPASQLATDLQFASRDWTGVQKLARRYGVSRAAMTRRLLEIRDLTAITIDITTTSTRPKDVDTVFVRTSENQQVLFLRQPAKEAMRFLSESDNMSRHNLELDVDAERVRFECAGYWSREDSGFRRYRVVGWRFRE